MTVRGRGRNFRRALTGSDVACSLLFDPIGDPEAPLPPKGFELRPKIGRAGAAGIDSLARASLEDDRPRIRRPA